MRIKFIKIIFSAGFLWAIQTVGALAFSGGAISSGPAEKFANMALECVHREYPNKISHTLKSEADVAPPHILHPVFYGCLDWHSAVHGHWLLVRLLHMGPEGAYKTQALKALTQSFTPEKVTGELAYFEDRPKSSYERPYGIAWFLQLMTELREWDSPQARKWAATLKPLEAHVVLRIKTWLPKLGYPIRLGTHHQSAFAFGLMLDWARGAGDMELADLLNNRVKDFYQTDINCPLGYEPSGEDFLSPCLMEADLMRRIMPQADFTRWLDHFLPQIPTDGTADWIKVGIVTDATDGKLVHLDGVNMSRAWNLENLAQALPDGDPRIAALRAAAQAHKNVGLESVTGDHYAGGHWLASFATYLMTKRGQ